MQPCTNFYIPGSKRSHIHKLQDYHRNVSLLYSIHAGNVGIITFNMYSTKYGST